jgi:hypothetical protein
MAKGPNRLVHGKNQAVVTPRLLLIGNPFARYRTSTAIYARPACNRHERTCDDSARHDTRMRSRLKDQRQSTHHESNKGADRHDRE